MKQRGARDVKHIGCELRMKPRQRKVKASPSIPKGGAAFKEKLTTTLSHIFSFDPLNNLQGQSYYYSSHFAGQKLQMSVCRVSSIAVPSPINSAPGLYWQVKEDPVRGEMVPQCPTCNKTARDPPF